MAAVTPKASANHPASGSNPWNIAFPGTPVSGDIVGIWITTDSTTPVISTPPTGWTLVYSTTVGTGSRHFLWKVLSSGDVATGSVNITFSATIGLNHAEAAIVSFDGTVYTGFGTIGTVTTRSTSSTTSTAVATGSSAAPNLVVFHEKTTSQTSCTVSGVTTIQNVLPVSTFAGSVFVGTYDDAGGTVTETASYGLTGNTNGAGYQIPMVLAAVTPSGNITVSGSGTLGITGSPIFAESWNFSSGGVLGITGANTVLGNITTGGSGSLGIIGTQIVSGNISASASGTLSIAGKPIITGTAAFSSGGSLDIHQRNAVDSLLANKPIYVAHRGGSADWVEETFFAYTQAYNWNINLALEISIWQTSDGIWVASHDQTTGRMFGTDLDIPTNTYATLSSLRTTTGNYPIAKLTDILTAYADGSRVFFIDDKGQQDTTGLLNILDTYGGKNNFIAKGFGSSTTWADAASARGYQTWGYYYDADVGNGNLSATQSHWSLLGMDALAATSGDWTAVKSYGKIVLAHIIATAAQKSTATGFGADGYVASGVQEVVPQTPAPITFAGSGVLGIAGTQVLTGTIPFTGSGSIAIAGKPIITGSVGFAGSGAVGILGLPIFSGTMGFGGSGTLAEQGYQILSGNLTYTGTGVLSITGFKGVGGSLQFTGAGALSIVGAAIIGGQIQVNGSGQLSVSGYPVYEGTLAFSSTGTLGIINNEDLRDVLVEIEILAQRWSGTLDGIRYEGSLDD